ncbi:MAG: NUDIX domain-containing protein [Pseudonocardiaceae bacterium]
MFSTSVGPRLGARVLLLDPLDRVLLIHARDPEDPGHHWWELPGGGLDKAGLIERRWWPAAELRRCQDKLLPANLLDDLLGDRLSDTPLMLVG